MNPSDVVSLSHVSPVSNDESAPGNSNSNLDNAKSISFRDMTYVNSNNQPPQINNFPLNNNDNSFDPNKSDKGVVYVNNVYISNLFLRFFK